MPKDRAALATGSPVRSGVPHHGLLGKAKDLRKTSLKIDAKLGTDGSLTITLKNEHAAHYVPSGLPERRIVVRVRLVDPSGKTETWHEQRELGRMLVDANGKEVPFWAATRVGSDTRIAPGGQSSMTFAVPSKGTIQVLVLYRGLSEAIANQLGVTDVEEQELLKKVLKK